MLRSFIAGFRGPSNTDHLLSRRRHPRRENDRCVGVIDGKPYPIENWSFGGALVATDERLFGMGQDVAVILKFRLQNAILSLEHKARIVRKSNNLMALKFMPLPDGIRRGFQQVIDDCVAREFAESQMA